MSSLVDISVALSARIKPPRSFFEQYPASTLVWSQIYTRSSSPSSSCCSVPSTTLPTSGLSFHSNTAKLTNGSASSSRPSGRRNLVMMKGSVLPPQDLRLYMPAHTCRLFSFWSIFISMACVRAARCSRARPMPRHDGILGYRSLLPCVVGSLRSEGL